MEVGSQQAFAVLKRLMLILSLTCSAITARITEWWKWVQVCGQVQNQPVNLAGTAQ
jgi:hypothetical protein